MKKHQTFFDLLETESLNRAAGTIAWFLYGRHFQMRFNKQTS